MRSSSIALALLVGLDRGITVAATPGHGAVVQRARELVEFARRRGYPTDELIDIIQDVD